MAARESGRSSRGAVDQKSLPLAPSMEVIDRREGVADHTGALSFTEIFRNHAAYLWRALVSLGVPESDVEDLCQEVMLVVHRRLPEFDGRALKSWLYSICLKVASDYRRRARVRLELLTETPPDTELPAMQSDVVDGRRAEARLLGVLAELDDDKRAAFVLYEVEQLTLREVAEALGCPLQTAYSRLQSARSHVRNAFGAPARVAGGARGAR